MKTTFNIQPSTPNFQGWLIAFLCVLNVWTALADGTPTVPASQAEVNAGTVHTKFVAPDTLKAWTGGGGSGGTNQLRGYYDSDGVWYLQVTQRVAVVSTPGIMEQWVTVGTNLVGSGSNFVPLQLSVDLGIGAGHGRWTTWGTNSDVTRTNAYLNTGGWEAGDWNIVNKFGVGAVDPRVVVIRPKTMGYSTSPLPLGGSWLLEIASDYENGFDENNGTFSTSFYGNNQGQSAVGGIKGFWNFDVSPHALPGKFNIFPSQSHTWTTLVIWQTDGLSVTNQPGGVDFFNGRFFGTTTNSAGTNRAPFVTQMDTQTNYTARPKIPTAVTVGASPFTFANATPYVLECYFSGGTAYSVTKNAAAVYGSVIGNDYFLLQPTNKCVITYTVAPTLLTNAFD